MIRLHLKKQIYTVGGYMLSRWKNNIFLVRMYIRLQYIKYYITHPSMFRKRMKIGDNKLRKVLDLLIGNTMIKKDK